MFKDSLVYIACAPLCRLIRKIRLVKEVKNKIGKSIMYSIIQKQAFIVTSITLCLFSYSVLMAEPVRFEHAQKAAETFLKMQNVHYESGPRLLSITDAEPTITDFRELLSDDGTVLSYIAELGPCGFIATSADTNLTPIVAYSFKSSFPADEDKKNPLYRLLKEDMKLRVKALAEYERFKTA